MPCLRMVVFLLTHVTENTKIKYIIVMTGHFYIYVPDGL